MLHSVRDIRSLVFVLALSLSLPAFVAAQPGTEGIAEGRLIARTLHRDAGLNNDAINQKPIGVVGKVTRSLGINSPDRDNNPIVSADGNIIFFYKAGEARRFPPWRLET